MPNADDGPNPYLARYFTGEVAASRPLGEGSARSSQQPDCSLFESFQSEAKNPGSFFCPEVLR
jgi:hypothetical protein